MSWVEMRSKEKVGQNGQSYKLFHGSLKERKNVGQMSSVIKKKEECRSDRGYKRGRKSGVFTSFNKMSGGERSKVSYTQHIGRNKVSRFSPYSIENRVHNKEEAPFTNQIPDQSQSGNVFVLFNSVFLY